MWRLVSLQLAVATITASVISFDPASLAAAISPTSGLKCVMVEFYAPWCGHCKDLAPKYDYVGKKFAGSAVTIAKIDADAHKAELGSYGVEGFPTLILFNGEENTRKKYEGAREPKNFVNWLNKHCGTTADASDWVAQRAPKRARGSSPLYKGFDEMNQLRFSAARATLDAMANDESPRMAQAANRILAKLDTVGKKVNSLQVEQWLQVDMETYVEPDLVEDDAIFVVARVDFRSGSRGNLEPLLEDLLAVPTVKLIRLTGVEAEVDDDMTYAVAVAKDNVPILTGEVDVIMGTQDCVVVYKQEIVWHGHVGILDEMLVASLKHIAATGEWRSLDQASHDEL